MTFFNQKKVVQRDILLSKINKSARHDDIDFNIVKKRVKTLHIPYMFLIFPFNRGITSIFNGGNESNLDNYRYISVLPCFSKMLEKIMHKNKHLNENNLFYIK